MRDQGGYKKVYSDAEAALESLRRCIMARAGGVQTPSGRPGILPGQILYERIDGTDGYDLLPETPMEELLRPLLKLHGLPAADLPPHDAFRWIDPTLEDMADDAELTQFAMRLHGLAREGTATLHGDFHPGLVVRREAELWLLRLDDLSVGPLEADLASFIAHLATDPRTQRADLDSGIRHWRREVLRGWRALGADADEERLRLFLLIALLQRALSLREQASDTAFAAIRSYLLAPRNAEFLHSVAHRIARDP